MGTENEFPVQFIVVDDEDVPVLPAADLAAVEVDIDIDIDIGLNDPPM